MTGTFLAKIAFMRVILSFSSEKSNRVSWCEMPAHIAPMACLKQVRKNKGSESGDNAFIDKLQ